MFWSCFRLVNESPPKDKMGDHALLLVFLVLAAIAVIPTLGRAVDNANLAALWQVHRASRRRASVLSNLIDIHPRTWHQREPGCLGFAVK
jgi:hypothetical protein